MPEKNTLIGGIIKNVRLGNGLDLQEVAKQAGISEELLEKIEALEVNPSLGLVVRFAEIFGVPVGKLMGDSADSSFCIVRRNAGTAISRFASANGRTAGYRYEGLAE